MGPQLQNQLHHKRLYKQNNKVMIKKTFYEAPETELILVRFEENILSVGGANNGYNGDGNDLGDLDDPND